MHLIIIVYGFYSLADKDWEALRCGCGGLPRVAATTVVGIAYGAKEDIVVVVMSWTFPLVFVPHWLQSFYYSQIN